MKMRILALAMASILLWGHMSIPVAAGAEGTTVPTVPLEAEMGVTATAQELRNSLEDDHTDPLPDTEEAITLAENGIVDPSAAAASETIAQTVPPLETEYPDAEVLNQQEDPAADETGDVSVIVESFSVEKPEFVSGSDSVLAGETYTFSYADTTNYSYADLQVTVGGMEVIPAEADGIYTIENVKDIIVINATQTPNSYNVTKPSCAEGPDNAAYGTDYVFTVTLAEEDLTIDGLKIVKEDGTEISYTINENGEYVIQGADISGAFAITVAQQERMADVLNDAVNRDLPRIDVHEYINLNGRIMFLVTAKWGDRILAYGEETMFYSQKYTVAGEDEAGAYCWVIVSTEERNTPDLVKAAAERTIVEAAEDTNATSLTYDCDINGTARVDVNDAQLAYDMYNASYMEFTETLPMRKFLEADLDGSMNLGIQDVVAITNCIVKQNA